MSLIPLEYDDDTKQEIKIVTITPTYRAAPNNDFLYTCPNGYVVIKMLATSGGWDIRFRASGVASQTTTFVGSVYTDTDGTERQTPEINIKIIMVKIP